MGDINQTKNRIHKVLEDANVQLDCVASDIFGVSGRAMLEAMMNGETRPEVLKGYARGRLRGKKAELHAALEGRVTEHHQFMLKTHYDHLRYLEGEVFEMEQRIGKAIEDEPPHPPASEDPSSVPFLEALEQLDEIPGLNPRVIISVLAEIGTNMAQFPTPGHLASWAGLCPGNNESAGKRKSGKTTKGSPWLRRALTEAAWAASRSKKTYFGAQYARIARRRGKKRAIIAVAHSLLITVYHMLKFRRPYRDLGPDFFDRLNYDRLTKYLVKRPESLGHTVNIAQAA
jgi:transposase